MSAQEVVHPMSAPAATIDVSIVVVTYNCLQLLKDCLASIPSGAEDVRYELIVVDNDSHDGTPEWVSDDCSEVRLLRNPVNAGFAKACNQGAREARGAHVLFLNPDTTVAGGTIRKTLEFLETSSRLAAAGCKVVRPDGSLDASCKRNFPSPWDAFCRMIGLSRLFPRSSLLARYDAHYIDEERRQEVPLIDGCYMMVRRAALEDVGLFDEQFFMYAEEMDWCKRAHQRGWAIGYDPTGVITHVKGEMTRHSPFRMLYHFHRSMALYCRKQYGPWNPVLLILYPGIGLRLALLTLVNLMRTDRRVSA